MFPTRSDAQLEFSKDASSIPASTISTALTEPLHPFTPNHKRGYLYSALILSKTVLKTALILGLATLLLTQTGTIRLVAFAVSALGSMIEMYYTPQRVWNSSIWFILIISLFDVLTLAGLWNTASLFLLASLSAQIMTIILAGILVLLAHNDNALPAPLQFMVGLVSLSVLILGLFEISPLCSALLVIQSISNLFLNTADGIAYMIGYRDPVTPITPEELEQAHQTLGTTPDMKLQEVTQKYRQLMLKGGHTDKGATKERTQEYTSAIDTLRKYEQQSQWW